MPYIKFIFVNHGGPAFKIVISAARPPAFSNFAISCWPVICLIFRTRINYDAIRFHRTGEKHTAQGQSLESHSQ